MTTVKCYDKDNIMSIFGHIYHILVTFDDHNLVKTPKRCNVVGEFSLHIHRVYPIEIPYDTYSWFEVIRKAFALPVWQVVLLSFPGIFLINTTGHNCFSSNLTRFRI